MQMWTCACAIFEHFKVDDGRLLECWIFTFLERHLVAAVQTIAHLSIFQLCCLNTLAGGGLGVFDTALFKKNEYFVWMNILDFKKMNILFEWIFWIFIKWIIFWTNILILFCPRQKFSLINVSKSSEIIQGSLMGPNSVHFRGSFTYTGASGRLRSHILASFWNFE